MDRSALALLVLIALTGLTACSSSEDAAIFDEAAAQKSWNTPEKNWHLSELRSLEQGRLIYEKNCAACHGKNGGGNLSIGAPSLVNSAIIKGDIRYHIALIKNGRRVMPAYAKTLSDEEIANVAAYERNAWGNHDYQIFTHRDK
ncbi:MAG: cytochrome c [Gammaproteobacteria bacterium]|nr:cytochrome c [Gammaproteobacteria bacterium]